MRLNNDCVRDLLLYLEEHSKNGLIDLVELELKEYNKDDIIYAGQKLAEDDHLVGKPFYADDVIYSFPVESITVKGYEFLEAIRPLTSWKKIKKQAKQAGTSTLAALYKVAVDLAATVIIKKTLG